MKKAALALLALAACNDAKLSTYENYVLGQARMQTWKTEEARNHPLAALLRADPEKLAAENAAKGDRKLYSFAGGYKADVKAAKPFGVICTGAKPATTPIVTGCVPPPAIVLKHMLRYNTAMIATPAFPAAHTCKPDAKAITGIDAYMQQEEQDWLKSREERRAERAKEIKPVNE